MDAGGKESVCESRRCKRGSFDPWVRKIPGIGKGNPVQYSCLESSTDRRVWQVTVHWVPKESDTTEGLRTPAHTQKNDEG